MTSSPDPFPDGHPRVYTDSGRSALERILRRESLAGSKLLLPAFICRDGFESVLADCDVEPVFVDVDRSTYHVDPDAAADRLPEVDAAMVVHAFGLPVRMDEWVDRCRRHDVVLIEDCARALGARVDGKPVGSFGDYAIYSLTKVSSVVSGGCLVGVSDAEIALRPPEMSVDHVLRTIYSVLSIELPESARSLYNRVLRTEASTFSSDDPTPGQRSVATDRVAREIDPFSRWLFERYVDRSLQRTLATSRSDAAVLRDALEEYGFDVQPDSPGRVYYVLSATVPGDRDELVSYLESRDVAVTTVWDDPWALAEPSASDAYPETSYLADHVVQFPIAQAEPGYVRDVLDHLDAFYSPVPRIPVR